MEGRWGNLKKKKIIFNTLCVVFLPETSSSYSSSFDFVMLCDFTQSLQEIITPLLCLCLCVCTCISVSALVFACVSRNYANGLCFLGRWSLVAMALAGGEIRSCYSSV